MRYHGVLLWNGVADNWLDVDTWSETCCAPGTRRQALGLVYPLLVFRTTWFGMPDVFSVKGE